MPDPEPRPGPRRDPHLRHQVVLSTGHDGKSITVSCNCRVRVGLEPIGHTTNYDVTMAKFNDPKSHIEPFDLTWMLTRSTREEAH